MRNLQQISHSLETLRLERSVDLQPKKVVAGKWKVDGWEGFVEKNAKQQVSKGEHFLSLAICY